VNCFTPVAVCHDYPGRRDDPQAAELTLGPQHLVAFARHAPLTLAPGRVVISPASAL